MANPGADLLLELFSEEIPARMQADAIAHVEKFFRDWIQFSELTFDEIKTYSTPRRLALLITGLPETSSDKILEVKGPKTSAPQAAIDGFLKKYGSEISALEKQGDGVNEVYLLKANITGQPLAVLIQEALLGCLTTFPWPKSMRWGSGETAWVRPLHSILCLFDGKVIDVEFAGVKAGNTTRGHRFLSGKELTISDAKSYKKIMDDNFVIADREERKANILQQVEKAAAAKGLTLKPDAGLLEEVVGLVEWPVVLIGTIDEAFMDLPPEVLTTVMRSHQKYFSLLSKDGKLAPHFVIVSNMTPSDGGKAIVSGNERVLRARFSDARFFWDTDRKKPLSDWAQGLKTVTYHAKLGTIAQKVERIGSLAGMLAETIGVDAKLVAKAAQLAKADLVTGMVGEFAELQGIMGRYYAQKQNEDAKVADAIRDHYKPQGPSDNVPTEKVAVCVALADKLDTLISMFAIGEKPTGSKDPFALRRAALGIIRIVLENDLRLPLLPLLAQVPTKDIALLAAQEKLVKQTEAELKHPPKVGKYLTVSETATQDIPEGTAQKVAAELLAFFHDRLIVQMKDQGIRHDVIKAVIASGDDDLVRIVARAKAVQEFIGTEDGKNLLAGYKRAANILSIEEKKDNSSYRFSTQLLRVESEIFTAEEHALLNIIVNVQAKLSEVMPKENYTFAMQGLATLRNPVDVFFEKIMINHEDKTIRANRLRLLSGIRESIDVVADFSKIEG